MPVITKSEARKKGIPLSTLQTIQVPKDTFTLKQAREWLKKNGYAYHYHRLTSNYRRFMQTPDIKDASYYAKTLPNGIILTFQKY